MITVIGDTEITKLTQQQKNLASIQLKRIFGKTDTTTTMEDTMDVIGIPTSTTTEFIQQTSQDQTIQHLVT